jgi:hypothetical protein
MSVYGCTKCRCGHTLSAHEWALSTFGVVHLAAGDASAAREAWEAAR